MEPLRDRVDAYLAARERRAYRAHSAWDASRLRGGRHPSDGSPGDPGSASEPSLDADALEEAFGELTSGDVLETLRAEREETRAGPERAGLERVLLAAEAAYTEACVRPQAEQLQRAEREGAGVDEVGALREELFLARGEVRARLGHATGLERARARLPGVDFEAWVRAAERTLDATDVLYRESSRDLLPRLGIDPAAARQEHAARIDHLGGCFETLFPEGRALECLATLLEPLGVVVDRIKGLRIDDEPREGRAADVAPFAIWRPGEVVVSAGARVGPRAYAATFHAVGRALAAAFTAEVLPVERRRPHDRALEGAWGWWLSDRLADLAWLEDFPAGRNAEALARSLQFRQLFAQRRCAAQVELAWALAGLSARTDPRRLADRWAAGLRRATGLEHVPPRYLEGQDAELSAIDQMRGRCFAQALAAHLRDRFGWRFWRERRAGSLLKELWNTGSSYTVEELASQLGLGALSPDPWIAAAARGI